MGKRQVRVEYSGAAEFDINEDGIADDLGDIADPTDEQVEAAIRRDIAGHMEYGSNVAPVEHGYQYDREALIASVRSAITRRKAEIEAEE